MTKAKWVRVTWEVSPWKNRLQYIPEAADGGRQAVISLQIPLNH